MENFTCDVCKKTYPKGWTDEEAAKEAQELWGAKIEASFVKPEDFAVICDDCFNNRNPIERQLLAEDYKNKRV